MTDTKCDFEGKRCYTLKDANTLINMARKRHWDNEAKRIPKRAYFCSKCGYYHLTKTVKHNGNKKRKTVSFRNTNERRRIERMEADIRRYTREYR